MSQAARTASDTDLFVEFDRRLRDLERAGAGAFERVRVGRITMTGGDTPDPGNLFCDGSLQTIAQYPELFARIGVRYGGDGVTNFRLPPFNNQNRFPRGSAAGGVSGGAASHSHVTGAPNEPAAGGYNIVAPALGFAPAIAHTHNSDVKNHEPPYVEVSFQIRASS